MPVSLEFSVSHQYNSSAEGIEVPVTLRVGGESVDLIAKLDTGNRLFGSTRGDLGAGWE
jgi:hypothetical protein